MQRILWLLAAGFIVTAPALAQKTSATEKEIASYETALGQAMIHKDIPTLTKLVADDWTIQSDSGTMGTKAGFIDDVKSGRLIVTSFNIHDVHVRVLGHVAFIQAFDDEKSSYEGKDNSGTYNWTDVWVNRDGQWVSLATQLTRVKSKE